MAHDDIDKIVVRGWKRLVITGGALIMILAVAAFFSQTIFVEIVKAGATGLVFTSVAYCFTWYRNWTVESSLKKSLTPNGVTTLAVENEPKAMAFGVTIENHTGLQVTVRDVEFYTETTRRTLTPNLLGKHPNVIQPNYRTDKTTSCSLSKKAIQEFVDLPPYTDATWGLLIRPKSPFLDQEIRGCSVLFQYPRLLGDSILVRVKASEKVAEMMNDTWNMLREKYK